MTERRLTTVLIAAIVNCSAAMASPEWIEHASIPSSDLPASGRSHFDQLFHNTKGQLDIPFPFERLIEDLQGRIENSGQPAVQHVLIARGRSLFRESVAPHYFRYPRSVIAVDGEAVNSPGSAGLVLKNRLFIAHQSKTGLLEIISYNDQLGRFEFQLVEGYATDSKPRLKQANRRMCLSCHQNAGPIFSQNPWSETNFNAEVAKRIVQAQPQKYPTLIGVIVQGAGITDGLVEKANYLSVAQKIWREGCRSVNCRAAILRAILQYRLSGDASFDKTDSHYLTDYLNELELNWKRQWPQGLALATNRLLDFDPVNQSALSRMQDPLTARPPQAVWRTVDDVLASGIVIRLASFLSRADIMRIDKRLLQLAEKQHIAARTLSTTCSPQRLSESIIQLECGDLESATSLQLRFLIEHRLQQPESIRFTHLKLPDDPTIWQPGGVDIRFGDERIELDISHAEIPISQRFNRGERMASVTLVGDIFAANSRPEVSIRLVSDFRFIDAAIRSIINDNLAGRSDSLAPAAFRRQAIVSDLNRKLGLPRLHWPTNSAIQASGRNSPDKPLLPENLSLLGPYCAPCHSDDSVNPPGFLYGKTLPRRLEQCAPRILARLHSWSETAAFDITPMPPAAFLSIDDTNRSNWVASNALRDLRHQIERFIEQRYPLETRLSWLSQRYSDLPACHPVSSED